jgi:hypothetical protein
MKNRKVCRGCKYHVAKSYSQPYNGTCNYCLAEGRSRLMIERKNGGYKTDSCVCYEKGEPVNIRVSPYGKDVATG